MAEITWEKPKTDDVALKAKSGEKLKFLIGGLLMLAAVGYLIISGTASGAQYFITVDELLANPEYVGETVRISGAVLGDSIDYDTENLIIHFTVRHIDNDLQDLEAALDHAVSDDSLAEVSVIVDNGQPKPDLLKHKSQAIMTGYLDENNVFHASELLLKCPSRYEESGPAVAESQ